MASVEQLDGVVEAGTPVMMVMSVTGDGELMIPCGIPWDGADARGASLRRGTVSYDEQGMVAFDRMGEGMWGPDRDRDGLAFVSAVMVSAAPSREDGVVVDGQLSVTGIEALFARGIAPQTQQDLLAALGTRYGAPTDLIGLDQAKALVPALRRRRRQQRTMRVGVIVIFPFVLVAATLYTLGALVCRGAASLRSLPRRIRGAA